MKVKVGVSNRHVHLSRFDYELLFDTEMECEKELSQVGEYKSNKRVCLKTDKGVICDVAVLGPCRDYTQVEISKTDAYFFGISPEVRSSGDVSCGEYITIVGEKGEIIRDCCIIATRHIHICHEDRVKYGLTDDLYSVKVDGVKPGILGDVHIKEIDNGCFELHLDRDDANAFMLKNGDLVEIIDNIKK